MSPKTAPENNAGKYTSAMSTASKIGALYRHRTSSESSKNDPSARRYVLKVFSKKDIRTALRTAEILTDGELMWSIVESGTDANNGSPNIPWSDVKNMTERKHEDVKDFEELDIEEKIKILEKGAKILFSKKEIDRTFEIIARIADLKISGPVNKGG